MNSNIFNPKNLHKLNNPERFKEIPPEIIWKRLNLKNPGILVDIGAGTGFITKEFMKLMDQGKIYAYDISDIMIDWMKKNLSWEYPNIIPAKIQNDTIPLENEFADLVYMINLHHEIENHDKMLKECYRILKPAGKIFIIDWKKKKTTGGPPTEIRMEEETVITQLSNAGFSNIQDTVQFTNHFFIIGEK